MNHKTRRIIALVLAVLLSLSAAGIFIYANDYYSMDAIAQEAMAGAERTEQLIYFPAENSETGIIFYPGGKVEAAAYAPLMSALADAGITCVIAEMPLNLAVLDMDAAAGIPAQFPDIPRWYIAGHSLGGSMAASYAAEAPDIAGVILLAAYSTVDLQSAGLSVLSIYGSNDGVLNMEKYEQYRANLPNRYSELIIEGGNHALFGSYGPQEGDGTATISANEQLRQTVDAIWAFVNA